MYVRTSDGLALAVQTSGDPANPVLIAVHGYPDSHVLWDPIVEILQDRFYVVTYDVRGCGESEAPDSRRGYRLEQLVLDLQAVADEVAPGRKVHLLGHDWGSIQCWEAVTTPEFAPRVASYTSVSCMSLDHAGKWIRRLLLEPIPVARQIVSSYYLALFQLPQLPELAARAGILGKVTPVAAGSPHVDDPLAERNVINGLELYRANMLRKLGAPQERHSDVPVLLIAPEQDEFVKPAVQIRSATPYTSNLTVKRVPGKHWIVADDPALIARLTAEFAGQH
ncbi:alpha/beta fold hydrolase [Smaragdicoccus niigatensis]|uniref:alpha/beta fold hydrolase n=1 Tax=Smaragdicoccus niigatensis TaxID=359359 RepID=UPI000476C254|nr:alpha/beta fold hydrolase [Smaragdicoccus niigatensis]